MVIVAVNPETGRAYTSRHGLSTGVVYCMHRMAESTRKGQQSTTQLKRAALKEHGRLYAPGEGPCHRHDVDGHADFLVQAPRAPAKRKPRVVREPAHAPEVVKVGDVGTYSVGSDQYAFDVVEVTLKGRRVKVAFRCPRLPPVVVTWRRTNQWVEHQTTVRGSKGLHYSFGVATDYIDPDF
mgnify:CR=1 FL=1